MKRYKSLVASLWATLFLFSSGIVTADSGQLNSVESDALEFLMLYSESKSEAYLSGSGRFEKPAFALLAADEQRHAEVLADIAEHFSFEENREYWGCYVAMLEVDGLDLLCNPFSQEFLWAEEWETFVPGAAYLEELIIRELTKALDNTDEQLLIEAYSGMLDGAYLHLLKMVSILGQQPVDYEAQLLEQVDVDDALEAAAALISENFEINAGLNDIWYNPSTDGQGISVSVFEDKQAIFLAWHTFDTDLPDAGLTSNLGDPGQRWLTAQGFYEGNQAELTIYSSAGGVFDTTSPLPELVPVGSIFLKFEDCSTGIVNYQLPALGMSGSIPIERVAADNIAQCTMNQTAGFTAVISDDDPPGPSSEPCYVSEGEAPTTVNQLFAVWGSGSSDVFAVGGAGTILHYDGIGWTPMAWGAGFGFEGVWGSSGTDVYAVGGFDGFGLALGKILHYDGSCWREVFSTEEYQFTDIWGSGSTDVYAATSREGGILHYDGTAWAPVTLESGTVAADGANGVWGTGHDDVFAVDAGTVWHYDGSDWQLAASMGASITEGTLSLRRVWGSSSADVFAVGTRYTAYQAMASVWHYDGTSWEFMPSGSEGARWDVWGSSSSDVFVVGDTTGSYGSDKGLISHYNGTTWTNSTFANTPTLQGVWGSSANDVFVVGGGARNGFCCEGEGTILHFDGNDWEIVMEYGRFQ
jgi:hypothetical protein